MNSLRTKTKCHNFSVLHMVPCSSLCTRVPNKYLLNEVINFFLFNGLLLLRNILTKDFSFPVFLTGNDRQTVRGLLQTGIIFCCPETSSERDNPKSLVCHNILCLPKYSTMERVEEALQLAINSNRGFVTQ